MRSRLTSRPASFAKEWLSGWAGALVAIYGLLVVSHLFYVFTHVGGEGYVSAVSSVYGVLIYTGPCILAWRASRQPSLSPRTRKAWLFVAIAYLSFLIGESIWFYSESVLGIEPFPSWADVGYLMYYPLLLTALLLFVDRFRSVAERLNFWLDSSVVLIAGGLVLWYFLLRPLDQPTLDDPLLAALTVAYPAGDLVLLVGILSLTLRPIVSTSRGTVYIILAGMVVNFIADFIFGHANINGLYQSGDPVDALFTLACFPVMIAAHRQRIVASRVARPQNVRNFQAPKFYWVPYAAIGIVYSVLVALIFEQGSSQLDAVIVFCGVVAAVVVLRQFTFVRENTQTSKALTELNERIQGIYSASTDAIGLADFTGTMIEVNDSFLSLTGRSREEIIGKMQYREFVPADYLDRSVTPEMAIGTGRSVEYECEIERKDKSIRAIATTLYTVNDATGRPDAMAVVIRDITERRSLEQQLTHQAMHDGLTGLPNRVFLRKRIDKALRRARRRNSQIAVLFLDLDNFKPVNDTLGHAAGDKLLITVADRLQSCLRGGDTASRVGGDEFAALIEDVDHEGDQLVVAERILDTIRAPIILDGKEVFVGASIGIALSDSGETTSSELLQNADVAMYTAKNQGRNSYVVYEQSMHEALVRRAELENQLRTALDRGEFSLRFHPMIDLRTNEVVAAEALLRWDHPTLDIGPSEFIPIAEEANLIQGIGLWVLEEACRKVAKWNRDFGRDMSVSVNISSRQVHQSDFRDVLTNVCDASGLRPANLILEITESIILQNTDATVSTLNELRQLGIRLAIDDFGTGYSSLSYLQKFPVDILKIDRSFVENVGDSKAGAAMARAIVSMSQTLHLVTIAEGIEDLGQVAALKTLGCDWGQGYHFAHPLTSDEMNEFLRRWGDLQGGNEPVPQPAARFHESNLQVTSPMTR